MGILKPADWQAKWIAGATNWQTLLLRREFAVKPGLKRASSTSAVSANTKCRSTAKGRR